MDVLFNSISVISELWADDHERLCAMEIRLRFRRFRLERDWFKHILLFQFYNHHTSKYIQYTFRDWNGSQMLIEFLFLT